MCSGGLYVETVEAFSGQDFGNGGRRASMGLRAAIALGG